MEYQTRSLRENDREMILEIARKTWSGNDHLPHMFEDWMSNPDCHTVAVIQSEKVAALGCVRVIDDGHTGWLEGLRVHQDHQGKGLARIITTSLKEKAIELGVERIRLTASMDSPIPNHLAQSISMRCLYSLHVKWLDEFERVKAIRSTSMMREISIDEFLRYGIEVDSLIPYGVVIYHWYAFDITNPPIKEINQLEDLRFWLAKSQLNEIEGVAMGFQMMNDSGSEWCTTIYPNSLGALLSLLSKQGEHCLQYNIQDMMLLYPIEFSMNPDLMDILNESMGYGLTLNLYEGNL
ncbi:MAG: GNAT family N-acetyltransferase [Candidatus Thorarchaeota archaeon]|nr:GNAT family N-acetyltransferase [Candidatus Thorarchaeota archaeon]